MSRKRRAQRDRQAFLSFQSQQLETLQQEAVQYVQMLSPEAMNAAAAVAMQSFAVGKMFGQWREMPETWPELSSEQKAFVAYFCACTQGVQRARDRQPEEPQDDGTGRI
jgi:erythromycin esterase-like protein